MKDVGAVNIETIKSLKNGDGFIIRWRGSHGVGEYLIYMKDGKIYGDSEYMDRGEDKNFLKALLNKLVEDIIIE